MLLENKKAFDRCNITAYHRMGYQGQGVKIALLDLQFKPNEVFGDNIEFPLGYDEEKEANHGSMTANIINQILPKATIYALPWGSRSLEFCLENDIQIINMSGAYRGGSRPNRFLEISKKIYEDGGKLFSSAGNYSEQEKLYYPARSRHWCSVGAVTWNRVTDNLTLRPYSSHTKEEQEKIKKQVEICGVTMNQVVHFDNRGNPTTIPYGGTSGASPFVASMAGLIDQKFEKKDLEQFRDFKQDTTLPVSDQDGYCLRTGYGLLQLPVEDKKVVLVIGENEISINEQIKEMDVAPFLRNERTFVPLRFVSEALGYDVEWREKEEIVKIGHDVIVKIGDKKIKTDTFEYEMDVEPFVEDNRTFVPLRFVSEVLGYDVTWKEAERKVIIENF